jgi:oxygen-independent coproporphyrinogen-3 oxidase
MHQIQEFFNVTDPVGLYVHIPFCQHKCAYCNFASGEFPKISTKRYLQAIKLEMQRDVYFQQNREAVKTIFIGGGTPSLLTLEELGFFLEIFSSFNLAFEEWTMEVNPASISFEKLFLMKEKGVTRISVGIQSLQNEELKFLERRHNSSRALKVLDWIRMLFPNSWSADLIYGLPEQDLTSWEQTLEIMMENYPKHLSLYELSYEAGTPLERGFKKGKLKKHSDEMLLEFQKVAEKKIQPHLQRYEISNYSVSGRECRHHLNIWRGGDFFAFGCGAHGRRGNRRYRNLTSPGAYMERIFSGKSVRIEEEEDLTVFDQLTTALLLALRLKEGISDESLKKITHRTNNELWPVFPEHWHQLLFREKGLRCKNRGWNVCNTLISELLEEVRF